MRGEIEVIRTKLSAWEGNGMVRFYYDNWDHYLTYEQLCDYEQEYRVDPKDFKLGIKVFFDGNGELHIQNCHDPDLKAFLEKKMNGWYHWAYDQFMKQFISDIRIDALIRPYVTEIKPGFYQIRYKDMFLNLDDLQYSHLMCFGTIQYDSRDKRYIIKTEYPRFDKILKELIADRDKELADNIGFLPHL